MTIPIVEEMWCKNCDRNPEQAVMQEDLILCGFCGKIIYTYSQKDIVKDWAPNWSQELRNVMNGLEPLVSEISKKGEEE